jgi:hypothetical protein
MRERERRVSYAHSTTRRSRMSAAIMVLVVLPLAIIGLAFVVYQIARQEKATR